MSSYINDPLLPDQPSPAAAVRRARHALYTSHALSAFGWRAWEFAVGLLMLRLRPSSLALVAAFGLADTGGRVLLGASAGSYLSRTPRLRGATTMYLVQNLGVAASAGALFPLLDPGAPRSGLLFWTLTATAMLFGALTAVGAMGATVAVEREWAKALCRGDSAALAAMNSGMRRIDLTCLMGAPIVVGCLMTFAGPRIAIAALCAWNLVAWAPECAALCYGMARVPHLRDAPVGSQQQQQQPKPAAAGAGNALRHTWDAWAVYVRQPVLPAAFSLALLYLTVMNLGLLMTAFLKARGMTEAVLAQFRALGAIAGVAATVTYPSLHRRLGGLRAGALGIWLQAASLCIGAAPILAAPIGLAAPPPAVVTYMLVTATALSRWGLWTFDLAVSQMLQERVAGKHLTMVGGVQSSLQSLFGASSYVTPLVFSSLQAFEGLMVGSCGVVLIAAAIYTAFQHPASDGEAAALLAGAEEEQPGGMGGDAAGSDAGPAGGVDADRDRLLDGDGDVP